MEVCPGIKRDGGRCTQGVKPGEEYCHNHDPARAEQRKRAASRAGKSKPSRELAAIKRRLQELTEGVLGGSIERADAAVAGQLFNTILRAIAIEGQLTTRHELHAEQFTYESQRMVGIIAEHIKDRETLRAIADDVRALEEETACPHCFERNHHEPRARRRGSGRH